MRWLVQTVVLTLVNLRSLPQRLGWSIASVLGMAFVVAVFVSVLSIGEGFRAVLTRTGAADGAMVFRGGTDTEMNSVLSLEETRVIADAHGIRRDGGGPQASAEVLVIIDLPKKTTGTEANVPLRGVEPAAFAVHDNVRIVEGRRFEEGRNEIIAGKGAVAQFRGVGIGSKLRLGQSDWTVVGTFEAGGSVDESELWCDAKVLQPAYQRQDSFQSVRVRLESAGAFDAFKDALTTDPRLDVKVVRERDYWAEQSTMLTSIVRGLGILVAGLMGVGAVFGALNTMYTAVSSRTREIATLRALGFGGSGVAVSVLAESFLLAVVGGLVGGGFAYVAFNGYQTTTMNWQSFSQVAFAFAVTPALLVQGLAYSLLMGLVGGIFPAIRAARIPVAAALREL